MNEVIRQLYERKSVRVFEDREISPEDKQLILEAAAMAPTAGNQQLYTILDITDQKLKEQLAVTCDNQPFIAKAKLVLIFCADCRKWYEAFEQTGCNPRNPGVGDLLLAVSDTNIAAQNAVTAAWSLGIGSCYIGDVLENCEKHREMLNLPKYVIPAAMVVFGYPTQQQLEREKPKRAALNHIVHENGYRKMDEAEYQDMFLPKTSVKSYEDWMKAFCDRKYNSDFAKEMTRSLGEYLKDFKTDSSEYSYFSHKKCEYFPCHEGADPDDFNCLFCYCPLYALGKNCGGNFRITEKGIKDCSKCLLPHKRKGFEYVTGKYKELAEVVKTQL